MIIFFYIYVYIKIILNNMKHVKLFEEYTINQDELNEGFGKNILFAGLLSLMSMTGMANSGGGDPQLKKLKATTTSTQKVQELSKTGWVIDSVTIDTLINKLSEKYQKVDTIKISLNLYENFESGSYNLSENGKTQITDTLIELNNDGYMITKIDIVSSTDKTPISKRMTSSTGIKDNKELSKKRNDAIKDYLVSNGYISEENSNMLNQQVLSEEGGLDDKNARYVTVNIYGIQVPAPAENSVQKTKTTYHMSKSYMTKKGQISPNTSKGNKKIKKTTYNNNQLKEMKAIMCAKVY